MTRLSVVAVLALLFPVLLFAESADLSITSAPPSPQYTPAGYSMRLFFTLRNDSADAARDVKVTIDVPPNVVVESATAEGVQCDTTARPVVCTAGDLSLERWRLFFEVHMRAPVVDASYTITASVTSATPDPNPANNSISVTYDNRVDANLYVSTTLSSARVDPGEAFRFHSSVHNIFETVPPSDIRMQFDAPGATIEKVEATPAWTCTLSGEQAVCTALQFDPSCDCARDFYVTVRTKSDRSGGVIEMRTTATSNLPERFPGSNTVVVKLEAYRWLTVTTTADAGPGSLRAAIEEANATCLDRACKIVFEIPAPVPAEGWFTITPSEPLPRVTTRRAFIDGARQTVVTGDTNPNGPEIAIDGRLAHYGLEMHSQCEAVVRGLAIGNFDANQGLWMASRGQCEDALGFDQRLVTGNHIGVDPTGTVAWPNLRGIRGDDGGAAIERNVISHNTHSGIWLWRGSLGIALNHIERNGSSGIFAGPLANARISTNVIAHNREMGIAAASGNRNVALESNRMRANGGLGIDWGLNGPSRSEDSDATRETNSPVLLSARFDPDSKQTYFSVQWRTVKLSPDFGNSFLIELFANETPDGEGEIPLGTAWITPADVEKGTFEVAVEGDPRGKWITATATRLWRYFFAKPVDTTAIFADVASTSEMSNAILVP